MPFQQGINQIISLTDKAVTKNMYSNKFNPAPTVLPDLVLLYPGRIKNRGDYRLELNYKAISHTDIVEAVHVCTLSGNGLVITNFLVDLYKNGLNASINSNIYITVKEHKLNLEQFKYLIYWLILQEDINYPRPTKMGIRMPLIRYIEGAISALHPNLISLKEVFLRTNNHGRRPDSPFVHDSVTSYLTKNILSIK